MVKLAHLPFFLHLVQNEIAKTMVIAYEIGSNERNVRSLNVFKPKDREKVQGQKQCIDVEDWQESNSNCFQPHKGPGCDNEACEALICKCDPTCCEEGKDWTAACAGVNEKLECGARCDCLCSHQDGGVPGQGMTPKPSRRPTKPPTPRPSRRPTKPPTPSPTMEGNIPGQQQCIAVEDWRLSNSNCFQPHEGPGCDNKACEALICACDPGCCENDWNGYCAGVNEALMCGARCDCLCIHQDIPGVETTLKPTHNPTKSPTQPPTEPPRPYRPTTRPTPIVNIPGQEKCIDVEDWRESDSNCFYAHEEAGCDDQSCQDFICSCRPECCEDSWTEECAGYDEAFACGARCDCLCSHQ